MNRLKQKQKAIERMKLLKLNQNIIREFEKDDIVNLSENGVLSAIRLQTQFKLFRGSKPENGPLLNPYTILGAYAVSENKSKAGEK